MTSCVNHKILKTINICWEFISWIKTDHILLVIFSDEINVYTKCVLSYL